jgi:hypothetical protein
MNKLAILALIAVASPLTAFAASDTSTVRSEAAEPAKAAVGKMLYSGAGYRLAPVYRVNSDGNPQVVLDGKLVTIPATTLTDVGGKLTTSLTKKDVSKL